MSVHVPENAPQVYAATIKLSSPDGMEHRVYKIDFLCKTPVPSSYQITEEGKNKPR